MKTLLVALCLVSLVACNDSKQSNTLPDIDNYVSIAEGVYGQVSYVDDVGSTSESVIEDFEIHVFTMPFKSSDFGTSTPLISTSSNSVGFYEIPLQVSTYCICTDSGRCAGVNLEDKSLIRIDYEMSVGPGWQTSAVCE